MDQAKRAKLGEPFAKSCETLLDERMRNMFRAVSTLRNGCYYAAGWWTGTGVLGSQWYGGSGWQEQTAKLYEAAAGVEAKVKGQ